MLNTFYFQIFFFLLLLLGMGSLYATSRKWISEIFGVGIITLIAIIDLGIVDKMIIEPIQGSYRTSPLKKQEFMHAYLKEDSVIRFLKSDTTKFRILPLGTLERENRWSAFQIEAVSGYHPAKMANYNKPILMATGASELGEITELMAKVEKINKNIVLMQCNTNYTASLDNFKYIELNVLKEYRKKYPDIVLGLSDHTPGHATVLGSIALGARVIEKHFTDSNERPGPDHAFAMTPDTWREMVDRTRELEAALGSHEKFVADNEKETVECFHVRRRKRRIPMVATAKR